MILFTIKCIKPRRTSKSTHTHKNAPPPTHTHTKQLITSSQMNDFILFFCFFVVWVAWLDTVTLSFVPCFCLLFTASTNFDLPSFWILLPRFCVVVFLLEFLRTDWIRLILIFVYTCVCVCMCVHACACMCVFVCVCVYRAYVFVCACKAYVHNALLFVHTWYWTRSFSEWPHTDRNGRGNQPSITLILFLTCFSIETIECNFFCSNYVT